MKIIIPPSKEKKIKICLIFSKGLRLSKFKSSRAHQIQTPSKLTTLHNPDFVDSEAAAQVLH